MAEFISTERDGMVAIVTIDHPPVNALSAPLLEELAADKDGQIRVAKVNIDDNPMTPTKYGVRGIPTLMLFKNGEISATKVGAAPKSKLYEWVEEAL